MSNKPNPDAILAHVRVERATDKLLEVAQELRDARQDLQLALHPTQKEIRVPFEKRKGGKR
jgi:hypothetical protein